jgi:DNA repair protein RadC
LHAKREADMRLKDLCADEMPREKMQTKGSGALTNTELLAILLRTGRDGLNVIDMARELIMSGGGTLGGIAEMSIERLCEISGIGPGKAVAIAAAFELGRRVAAESAESLNEPLSCSNKAFRIMQPLTRDLDHEECWALYLNKSNRLICKEMLTSGGLDSTVIDNKTIIRKAIERKASGLILVHNHPSGNPYPSTADINQTLSLNKAMKTCEISLVDHIIIGKSSYYSFADEQETEKF